MSAILGINFGHDGAAAIVLNGKLVSAISRERITRKKKDRAICAATINYVLSTAGIDINEINVVSFSSYFYQGEHENADSYYKFFEKDGRPIRRNLAHLFANRLAEEYVIEIGGVKKPALLIHHHMAHAASAYYTSPFDNSACFSLDASGLHPELCSVFAYGSNNHLHYLYCPGIMAGNVYSVFTERLGIGPGLTKAGTTMALAAFGKPLAYTEDWEQDFASWYKRDFQDNDAAHTNYLWTKWTKRAPHQVYSKENELSQEVKDHAASLQFSFEQILIKEATRLYQHTKSFNDGNLVLSGGSFLNSDANMRIFREAGFERIHLFPACGDDGTAAGVALYTAHMLLGQPRATYQPKDYMYLGKDFLQNNDEPNYTEVAKLLAQGKIVAWYQGRSEFGPRALGNRSFLADPRSTTIKDHINRDIKHRESYRPFAPAVLSEDKEEWFDLSFESKLMLFITQIKKPELLPAVSHIDNSARVQTVAENDNLRFYKLLSAFKNETGVPVLLNTSLNDNDEPLVDSPEDAQRLYNRINVDVLVLGKDILLRN